MKATTYILQSLKVLFIEKFDTLPKARKHEVWWKSGVGRRKLKEMFNDNEW